MRKITILTYTITNLEGGRWQSIKAGITVVILPVGFLAASAGCNTRSESGVHGAPGRGLGVGTNKLVRITIMTRRKEGGGRLCDVEW